MCRRNSGQSRRKRRICSRILVCSPALRSTTIEEGTVIPPTTRDKLALSGVADRNCRCHSLLQCVRPITWFDLVQKSPMADGWCRTRWSCATLALSLEARRGLHVSAETVRRWLHNLGWRWKRAKLTAKDNDPERAGKLARIRWAVEVLRPRTALLFADELDIALLPK